MASLPRATTSVQDTATALATGLSLVCIWAPVPLNADATPRQFGSASALYSQHGYSEGVEYAALHVTRTRRPFLFVPLPIATPGVVGRENTSGNTGSSTCTLAAGGDGVLHEHDGVLTVLAGGTIGTDQIVLGLSLDGGRTTKRVRLGTASSVALSYVGVTASFGAGTLVTGDTIHTWHGTGPRSDASGWAAARAALASQQRQFRSVINIGDLNTGAEATAILAQFDAYETANERFIFGRVSVRDRLPLASLSATSWNMTGAPSLTFADTGDTITRSAGSWLSDGAVVGDTIHVTDTVSNDGDYLITAVTASAITVEADDLADETIATATVTGEPTITFDDTGETLTRNRGSWLADGFRVDDSVTVDGTAGGTNDGTFDVTAVTALVLTLEASAVDADESIAVSDVSVTAGQTKAAWMADITSEFAGIDDAFRIDMSAGRGRAVSPFSQWAYRQPASWAASLREYQHDLHVATWRKEDGPVDFDLFDSDRNLVEWDDHNDGEAASAARFTSLRTWSNGPEGAFVALSLTRASDGSVLSLTHNVAVTNLACTTVQLNTENTIGRSLVLNADGTATTEALNTIAAEVNSALDRALLQDTFGEGPRASRAVWTPSSEDVLNVPDATLTGVLDLNLNGTIHSVVTNVRIRSGGQ